MLMVTKLGRVVTYHEELPPINSHNSLITWSFEITWQTKTYISTTTMHMTNKLGRMVACHDRLSPIKSRDHLITWSCEITSQTKHITMLIVTKLNRIVTFTRLMATKLDRVLAAGKNLITQTHKSSPNSCVFSFLFLSLILNCLTRTVFIFFFNYCFMTFTILMVTKFGRVLTTRKSFTTQTLKSSSTSCVFSFLFLLLILDCLTRVVYVFFFKFLL